MHIVYVTDKYLNELSGAKDKQLQRRTSTGSSLDFRKYKRNSLNSSPCSADSMSPLFTFTLNSRSPPPFFSLLSLYVLFQRISQINIRNCSNVEIASVCLFVCFLCRNPSQGCPCFSFPYLGSFPGNVSNAISLVEERLVGWREQRVFKQGPILSAPPPQSSKRLAFVRSHHPPCTQ